VSQVTFSYGKEFDAIWTTSILFAIECIKMCNKTSHRHTISTWRQHYLRCSIDQYAVDYSIVIAFRLLLTQNV
jgi:hypothetical protein